MPHLGKATGLRASCEGGTQWPLKTNRIWKDGRAWGQVGWGGVGEEALKSRVGSRREGRSPRFVLCSLEKGQVQPAPPLFFFKFNLEASSDCQQNPCHFFPGRYKNASGPRAEMAHSELRSAGAQLARQGDSGTGGVRPSRRREELVGSLVRVPEELHPGDTAVWDSQGCSW